MQELITITYLNNKTYTVPVNITAEVFFEKYCHEIVPVMACIKDGQLRELRIKLEKDCELSPVRLNSEDGVRIYSRTLRMVLYKAMLEVLPSSRLEVLHSLSKGFYCEFKGEECTKEKLKMLTERMLTIINKNIRIVRTCYNTADAIAFYTHQGMEDKAKILKYRESELVQMYDCDGTAGYFYGYMCPSTGYVPLFELKYHHPGFILRFPVKNDAFNLPLYQNQPKISALFMEYERWCNILGVKDVGSLNETIEEQKMTELMYVAEGLHEKKISQLADLITVNKGVKVIFIAGPSSSGKTTFAHRLMVQLRVNGVKPVTISLDDYFLNRENSPVDEEGNLDFDSIDALDLELFNSDLLRLMKGEEVSLPLYNFHLGKREYDGKTLKLEKNQILLIEGIHGLNERLSASIPKRHKFKIYVSALMQLNLDDLTPIKTTDTRLIRRIIRDFQFRSNSAENTIKRWPLVRRGEENNIFPYQEEADAMFNTALVYELAVLKPFIEPLLQKIPEKTPEFLEARRLLKLLQYFKSFPPDEIPSNSILKEFIGGGCFIQE